MSIPSNYGKPPKYTPEDPKEFDEKKHLNSATNVQDIEIDFKVSPPNYHEISNKIIIQNPDPIPTESLKIRKIRALAFDNIVSWLREELLIKKSIDIFKSQDRKKISELNIYSKLYRWEESLAKDLWFEIILFNPGRQSFIPKDWDGTIMHKRVDVYADGPNDEAFRNRYFMETCTKTFFAFVKACFISNDVNGEAVGPYLEEIINRGFTIEYAFLENEKKKIAYNALAYAAVCIGNKKIFLQVPNPDPIYEKEKSRCQIM